jgi:predicted metal-dependent HD superfamily phosphohydrolase
MELTRRFLNTMAVVCPGCEPVVVESMAAEIEQAYSSPMRHYHDARHIEHCLDYLEAVNVGCSDKQLVRLAIFYHDVVYDARASDNEERSAAVAVKRLTDCGLAASALDSVQRLIMATCHLGNAEKLDEQLIADIDLAELAADWATFVANTRAIRKEYSHVPDTSFNVGRAALFERMLSRPRIYYLDPFRFLFEERARENMWRSIPDLRL